MDVLSFHQSADSINDYCKKKIYQMMILSKCIDLFEGKGLSFLFTLKTEIKRNLSSTQYYDNLEKT